MEERIEKLAQLLTQTKQAHGQAFSETNDADPDWALWYANYLHDKLPAHLGMTLTRRDIAEHLTRLDNQHQQDNTSADWSRYYARFLLERHR